jgi:hypothetical protein
VAIRSTTRDEEPRAQSTVVYRRYGCLDRRGANTNAAMKAPVQTAEMKRCTERVRDRRYEYDCAARGAVGR